MLLATRMGERLELFCPQLPKSSEFSRDFDHRFHENPASFDQAEENNRKFQNNLIEYFHFLYPMKTKTFLNTNPK